MSFYTYITSLHIPSRGNFMDKMHAESTVQMPFYLDGPENYPIWLFPRELNFELSPITVFYGGNGSGKSTILNLLAAKLGIGHRASFNTSEYFDLFARLCGISTHSDFDEIGRRCDIIASDDVFQHCFRLRQNNKDISARQREVIRQKRNLGRLEPLHSLDDFERFRKNMNLRDNSYSRNLEKYAGHTLRLASNGETALRYFTSSINSAGVYLLDEPENSMSPMFQLELIDFLEQSSAYLGMQYIIATHSPLLLGMKQAVIFNLDEEGAPRCKWSDLENIRILHQFFSERADEFDEPTTKHRP